MSQRVMMIGLLIISAVAMFATDANAQSFDGWGFFGFSEITGIIELSEVPNPEKTPTVVTIEGSLNFIEVICRSPGGDVSPQNAGSQLVKAANAIDNDEITEGGHATVEIKFGAAELAAAERKAKCENPTWRVVPGSAAPTQMTLTLRSFLCRPESEADPEPCFRRNTDTLTVGDRVDTVNLHCTLPGEEEQKIRRDADFRPLHDHVFTCPEEL
jgi:hypothetical protein